MCLCDNCDPELDNKLKGLFLNELCDCDVYDRWICVKCAKDEQRFTRHYFKDHTAFAVNLSDEECQMQTILDHQHDRAVSFGVVL